MAHYGVNASVPKTLVRYLLRWVADSGQLGEGSAETLRAVLGMASSPELVPSTHGVQDSESVVGPFELQDFFLYYVLRFGYAPSKVAFLAHHAWQQRERGHWPDDITQEQRHEYCLREIKHWLGVFLRRFFNSQFKRSALPNAPKVGSGGCLSPRGDWRAPSDASEAVWLEELRANVPDE